MSTKIYNAYRLRPGRDLWAVAAFIKHTATRNVQTTLRNLYHEYLTTPFLRTEALAGLAAIDPAARKPGVLTVLDLSRYFRHRHIDQLKTGQRNDFDLDVGIAIHKVGRHTLLRAFAGSGWFSATLQFLATSRHLEDFHYQNASDRPTDITARAWETRRRIWDRALVPGSFYEWRPFLTLEIVTVTGWTRTGGFDPVFEISRDLRRNPASHIDVKP